MNTASIHHRLSKAVDTARSIAARRAIRILIRVVGLAVVVVVVLSSTSRVGQLGAVGRPDPIWLCAAVGAEIVSLLAYARMAREFLLLGGVSAPVTGLLRPTLAGIAMGATLPAGVGASNVYWYKQLRRHGADRGLSALVMTGTSAVGAIALVGLLAAGVALAGDTGPVASTHTWLLGIAGAAVVMRLAFAHRLGRMLTRALRRIAPTLETQPGVRLRRLRRIMALAYANWLLDCAALYCSLHAVHAGVPARGIVVVYVLAQLVANVALLPGGGGTVELALATGFAAFGHHGAAVLSGALLYRFLGCWGLIPVGWLAVLLDPERARARSKLRVRPIARRLTAAWRPHRSGTLNRQPVAEGHTYADNPVPNGIANPLGARRVLGRLHTRIAVSQAAGERLRADL